MATVNQATATSLARGAKGDAVLRAQVLLERARFSPGQIDAIYGQNMVAAVTGFQRSRDLPTSGSIDAATWAALVRDDAPALVHYKVQPADVAGPFRQIPQDMEEKAKLPALGFASAAEALGEKFHSSPDLLKQLNGGSIGSAGQTLVVPDVTPRVSLDKAAKVVVDKSDSTVAVVDAGGRVIAQYPATLGSEHDPLPIGDWTIKGVAKNPVFRYNPDLFWDADEKHDKAILQPGPNNPVGVAWIDLSKPHYGIHGTPEPRNIRRTESHGCIRLTNWSALELAHAVAPGMPAILRE